MSQGNSTQPAYSVAEFCAAHRIGRTFFYELLKQRRAPRLMKLGRRVLISAEAAADWRAAMEQATDQQRAEA